MWLLPSFTTPQRAHLLAACVAVVYTPPNEHFGIVPLEAMAHRCPVIACNSGGPCETVEAGSTGVLCFRPCAQSMVFTPVSHHRLQQKQTMRNCESRLNRSALLLPLSSEYDIHSQGVPLSPIGVLSLPATAADSAKQWTPAQHVYSYTSIKAYFLLPIGLLLRRVLNHRTGNMHVCL